VGSERQWKRREEYSYGMGGRLTTPHNLQAEARSRKRVRRRLVVYPSRKPTAEASRIVDQFGHPARREGGNHKGKDKGSPIN
jgi:hypothetical protein